MTNFNPQILDVVYATDKNYLPIWSTAAISLCDNNKHFEQINIHLLCQNLDQTDLNKCQALEKIFSNLQLHFYSVEKFLTQTQIETKGFPISAYSRLFMGSVLPVDLSRVLYLDGDILTVGKIDELWQTNLEDKICGGILDPVTAEAKTKIDLNIETEYFNTGVLLISLTKWREQKVEQKMIDFLNQKNGNVFHHDQGIINAILCPLNAWKKVPPKFDLMNVYLHFSHQQLVKLFTNRQICSQTEIDEARLGPVFYHDKFWTSFFLHPAKKQWWKYNNQSPFGKPNGNTKSSQKIINWMQSFMPFCLYRPIWQLRWRRKITQKGQI